MENKEEMIGSMEFPSVLLKPKGEISSKDLGKQFRCKFQKLRS
jgi:hypothetical protein